MLFILQTISKKIKNFITNFFFVFKHLFSFLGAVLTFRQNILSFNKAKKIVRCLENDIFGKKFPFYGISFTRLDKLDVHPLYQVNFD